MSDRDLIWVEKEFAAKYTELDKDKTKNEERLKVFDEYLKKVSDESRADFRATLEALEEDAAIYTGLMLKVKQAFGKAKDEALAASYAQWEGFDKERSNIHKKIGDVVEMLDPLEKKLNDINTMLAKIQTFNIDKFAESLRALSGLYGEGKEMVSFLIKNFKPKE